MKSFSITAISILTFLANMNAQDVNFSQFNVISSYYNPAFNSTFNGTFKVSAIQRNQWIGFQDQPITSFCIDADIKFNLGQQDYTGDYFGAGVYFITDRTQVFDWNSNEIGLMISYHKLLDRISKNYLSIGVGFGITQRSINYDNIYFEDQFDGIGNYNGTTNELLPPNIFSRPEMKLGLQHNVGLNNNLRLQYGIAAHYLLKPDLSFYNDFDDKDYIGSNSIKAPIKFTGIFNFIYHQNSNLDLFPKLMITLQGPHQLFNTGLSVRKSFYNLNQTAFHAGITTRVVRNLDSYIPSDLGFHVGFEIKDFIIGLHYDLGIKDALKYSSPTHSFEISLSLLGNYDTSANICPTF